MRRWVDNLGKDGDTDPGSGRGTGVEAAQCLGPGVGRVGRSEWE